MFKYILIFLFSVFISSVSQIMLKLSSSEKHERLLDDYLNPQVITAYIIFFVSSLLTIYGYKYVPLSTGPLLEASGYIFITILGWFYLHEKVGRQKIVGIIFILGGILLAGLKT